MELQEAIVQRRSIRRFTEDKVTDQELQEIFEAVRWSPSWANTQVWEFVVLRDKELISKVTGIYQSGKGTNPATKCSLAASALIVVCAKTGVSGCYDGKESTKFTNWFMFDLGIATQTLCLKAWEQGLGSVIIGSFDHKEAEALLAVPPGYEMAAIIALGYPDHEPPVPKRREVQEFVHYDRFPGR